MAKTVMIQGTASSAGKSLLATALCRIFRQDGHAVVPFKSQNMALNSFITREGLEMGRAQVVQAEAAGVEPSVLMNPILLKPTGDATSQVIVGGEVVATMPAAEYYRRKKEFIPAILSSFRALADVNDIVVIEGAGSPAEINLRDNDIVNMGMAAMADAPVLLVGDIDRGGVFASLYGTLALLRPEERQRVKGTVINKFRGDVDILRPGLHQLEELTGVPVLGVVPWTRVDIDDEDSVSSRLDVRTRGKKPLDAVVVRLPRLANFTDFNAIGRHPAFSLRYAATTAELGQPDLIIVPGSKNTMDDLAWMRQNGLEAALKKRAAAVPVIGICGGYQMLGRELHDPDGVEAGGSMRGMELLPVSTVFKAAKTRTRVDGLALEGDGFLSCLAGAAFTGYEIHMGASTVAEGCSAFARLMDGTGTKNDGAVSGLVMGTYVHGLFDSGEVTERLARALLRRKGLPEEAGGAMDATEYKERQYDILADAVRRSLDLAAVYGLMGMA